MSPGVPCAEAAAAAVEHRQCVAEKTQQQQQQLYRSGDDVQDATHTGAGVADLGGCLLPPILAQWCVVLVSAKQEVR